MAQIKINLGTPPSGQDGDPVRTAFEKTNTMFAELYKGYDRTLNSGWGYGVFTDTVVGDVNAIDVSRQFTINTGTANVPKNMGSTLEFAAGSTGITSVWDTQHQQMLIFNRVNNGIAYRRKNAGAWQPDDYLALYPTGKTFFDITQGGTGGNTQATAQAALGLVPVTTLLDTNQSRLVRPGAFGIGSIAGLPLPGDSANSNTLPSGKYTTKATWVGSVHAGTDGRNQGYLEVHPWEATNYIKQTWCSIYGSSNKFVRYMVNNVWGQWITEYDSTNAFLDPVAGGLMSRTVVGGLAISKFANGMMVTNGTFTTATAVLAANTFHSVDVSVPVNTGLDATFSSVAVNAVPSVTNDHYGVTLAYMASPTLMRLIIRNGGTAQAFAVRGSIIGHWK